jgi:pyruvate dehydrogenase complex dehydrogenase (E1) component
MQERRAALGGYLPRAAARPPTFAVPAWHLRAPAQGQRRAQISTTMAFVRAEHRAARQAARPRIVPIVADEARTFGMEGLFRQIGIYAPFGQKYKPVDADQLMYYREEERPGAAGGHQRAGAIASWMAAGTSYSVSNVPMLPFYIYYSMFGFQRVGDLAWQAATCARAASCWAAPPGAPRSTAKACSTRTASARSWPAASPTAQLRPDLRLRSRRDPAARHAAMLEDQKTSTTTSP